MKTMKTLRVFLYFALFQVSTVTAVRWIRGADLEQYNDTFNSDATKNKVKAFKDLVQAVTLEAIGFPKNSNLQRLFGIYKYKNNSDTKYFVIFFNVHDESPVNFASKEHNSEAGAKESVEFVEHTIKMALLCWYGKCAEKFQRACAAVDNIPGCKGLSEQVLGKTIDVVKEIVFGPHESCEESTVPDEFLNSLVTPE